MNSTLAFVIIIVIIASTKTIIELIACPCAVDWIGWFLATCGDIKTTLVRMFRKFKNMRKQEKKGDG